MRLPEAEPDRAASGPEAPPRLRLSVPVSRAAVEPARQAIERHLAPLDLSARDQYRVDLLLEEVLMNAVLHAFGDAPQGHVVEVSVEAGADRIVLRFEDEGSAFDPTRAPARAPAATLDAAEPGGLGLPMLRRFADQLAYRREGARNHLTVTLQRGR